VNKKAAHVVGRGLQQEKRAAVGVHQDALRKTAAGKNPGEAADPENPGGFAGEGGVAAEARTERGKKRGARQRQKAERKAAAAEFEFAGKTAGAGRSADSEQRIEVPAEDSGTHRRKRPS